MDPPEDKCLLLSGRESLWHPDLGELFRLFVQLRADEKALFDRSHHQDLLNYSSVFARRVFHWSTSFQISFNRNRSTQSAT